MQTIQGGVRHKAEFMCGRVPFPPAQGLEEIFHLGWLESMDRITKRGLWPGKLWAQGRAENHGSAANPRTSPKVRPGMELPGLYAYHGHLQQHNARYVWSNKVLFAYGVTIWQTRSDCLVSEEVWPLRR